MVGPMNTHDTDRDIEIFYRKNANVKDLTHCDQWLPRDGRTARPSPEGTLFVTIRARFRTHRMPQVAFAQRDGVFRVPFNGSQTEKGTLYEHGAQN